MAKTERTEEELTGCAVPGCEQLVVGGGDLCRLHPPVEVPLVGEDGNAFAILGRFQKTARRQKWDQPAISAVLEEARRGDYAHLLRTILTFSA